MLRANLQRLLCSLLLATALVACEDGSDSFATTQTEEVLTPAQLLLANFGAAKEYFSEAALEQLLAMDDMGNSVTLLQLHSVADAQAFATYEQDIKSVWETAGAQQRFSSTAFGQIIGERSLSEFRAVTFPSAMMLLEALRSNEFMLAMAGLAIATDDMAWVLGVEDRLPPPPMSGYVDPTLRNLTIDDAEMLLANAGRESTLEGDATVIFDMLLSDDLSPFWMVNLIDFFDEAMYPDGRESDLTGEEANAIYGRSIVPSLLAYNSFPELSMAIVVNLTNEPTDWKQAAIVRYASRDAFLRAFPLNPALADTIIHKEAGVSETLVYPSSISSETLPIPQNGPFYNYRYCEVLLGTAMGDQLQADVYNSIPFSDCPQAQWDALDAEAIAQTYGTNFAVLNGIRFWVLDGLRSNQPPATNTAAENFGGITMRLAASVLIPIPDEGEAAVYQIAEVSRDTVWTYVAGRQVYELTNPDGDTYMMQSFSQAVDREQTLGDLQFLGRRLTLPPGWQFSARVLREDFELRTVDGIAEVVTDDFSNVYQRVPQ